MAYQFTQTGAEIQDILDLAQLQIAAPYDSASSYTAGDYCTKDDGFYVCTASTSGTWDASKWSAVTVGDVLETANANISALNATLTSFSNLFSATPTAPTAYSSRCTGISDGYIRVGNVVYVSVRFELSSATSGATVVLQGMPYPLGTRGLTAINASTNATLFAYVNGSGQIGIGTASSGNSIVVSGVYFARS